MSEETQNDGTWSGLKKTIIGTLSTAVLAGGTYLTTTLFGAAGEDKEDSKTEQVAQPVAQPIINVNLENNNTNQQKQSGGQTIIKERVIEKPAAESASKPKKEEEDPW
jgi:flagellar basal body-associated protein FliL